MRLGDTGEAIYSRPPRRGEDGHGDASVGALARTGHAEGRGSKSRGSTGRREDPGELEKVRGNVGNTPWRGHRDSG